LVPFDAKQHMQTPLIELDVFVAMHYTNGRIYFTVLYLCYDGKIELEAFQFLFAVAKFLLYW